MAGAERPRPDEASRRNLDDIKAILAEPFPSREFTPRLTTSERNRGLSRPPDRSTQRDPRPEEVSGETNGIPLSTVEFDEIASTTVLNALLDSVDKIVSDTGRAGLDVGPVPAGYSQRRTNPRFRTYVDEEYLRTKLLSELEITGECLNVLRPGEDWDVCPDWSFNKAPGSMTSTAADIAAMPANRVWEGGVLKLKARRAEVFRRLRDLMVGRKIISIISTRTRRSTALGVESPVILLPILTGDLLFFAGGVNVSINGIEYFRLCVSQIHELDGLPLRKILAAVSLLNVSEKPLRLPDMYDPVEAAKSPVMPDEIGWTNEAKRAFATLQAHQRRRSGSGGGSGEGGGGGGGGGAGGPSSGGGSGSGSGSRGGRRGGGEGGGGGSKTGSKGGRSAEGGKDAKFTCSLGGTSAAGSSGRRRAEGTTCPQGMGATGLGAMEKSNTLSEVLPAAFELVLPNGSSATYPQIYERVSSLATLPAAHPSPPASDFASSPPPASIPSPLDLMSALPRPPVVRLDTLVYAREGLRIYASRELGLIFKMAYYGDDAAEELEQESGAYEELYRSPTSASFLAPYVGTYEWYGVRLALVTAPGTPINDWKDHADEVITLVSGLHKAGYIHGDLASRNFVQYDNGLRIVDLGRAEKADEEERAWEMSELKAVLAGLKDEIEYGML